MPVITIDLGIMESREKKAELIKALTEAASTTTKIPAEKFIVFVNEFDRDNIGVGGRPLSDIMK
jgi:4-oxalocrotonate tautomerase